MRSLASYWLLDIKKTLRNIIFLSEVIPGQHSPRNICYKLFFMECETPTAITVLGPLS